MRLTAVLGVLILTVLGFWACQYSIEEEVGNITFQTSLKSINPQATPFTFIAEQGFTHEFASGTEIQIPGGILMKENGELVNGEVDLSIQEFQDAIDLLVGGVPMNLNEGMARTAGAFKIEASQNGEQLLLDPTKNIEVRLACYEKEEGYSLYFLNEKDDTLDSLFQIKLEMNEDHIQLERSIKRMKPWIKFPLSSDHFAFSYKGILDVIYNKDLTNVSHQMTQKKMEQYGLRWSSLNVESVIEYKGKQELAATMVWRNISRKPLPDWIKEGKGSLEKIKKNRYRLIVQDSSGTKNFSTQIEPVISLNELFSVGPGYWKKNYESKIEKTKLGGLELHEMASAFRSFRVNRFGVYNWLKFTDEIPAIELSAQFKMLNTDFKNTELPGVFYLTSDRKGLRHYPISSRQIIQFFDDPNDRIFSFTPDREVLLFPTDRMSAIDFDQFKKMNQPSFIFKLEKQKQVPASMEELRKVLKVEP